LTNALDAVREAVAINQRYAGRGPDHQANLADTLAACAFVLIELGSLSQDYVVCYSVDGQARRVRPLRPGRKKYSPPRTVTNGGMGDRK
jgi:hypothetical protein